MTNKIIGLFFILFFISACSEDEDQTTLDYSYPLNVGNAWTYEIIHSFEPFSSNESDTVYIEDRIFYVTITIDTMYNEIIDAYRFKIVETDGDTSYVHGYDYFANAEDGLYHLGGSGGFSGTIPWSDISIISPPINNHLFSKSTNTFPFDSLSCWENPPLVSMQYPIVLGQQWNYREHMCDDSSAKWEIDKVVTNINQDTFVIVFLWGENFLLSTRETNNLAQENTYNSNGMIESRFEIDSLMATDEMGNPLDGLFKEIWQSTLINFEIVTD